MKARHRASAWRTREAAAGSVRATCTTFSRPSAMDKIVRSSGNIIPCGLAAADPPGLVERAGVRPRRHRRHGSAAWTLPARAAVSTLSEPLMRLPARASMPRRSSAAWRSACLGALAEIGGDVDVVGLERALQRALELALGVGRVELGAADRRSRRRGPGARARTSGATSPSGPSASRISSSLRALAAGEDAGAFGDVRLGSATAAGRHSEDSASAASSVLASRRLRPRTSARGRP